jgi:hypothetical protein
VPAGGGLLWKRELGTGPQLYGQLAVAPLDSRQLCLCGSSGSLVVLQLSDPARDKVAMQQYRVNTQAAGASGQLQQPQQLHCYALPAWDGKCYCSYNFMCESMDRPANV